MPHKPRRIIHLLMPFAFCLICLSMSDAQSVPGIFNGVSRTTDRSAADCNSTETPLPITQALRSVCLRTTATHDNILPHKVIIIGFVGGFVRQDDPKHPEVHFARFLSENYPSIHAEVFANHDGAAALHRVLQLLGTRDDGTGASIDNQPATIIIYGHSWGGSQAVILARQLGNLGVPVSLTIQLDSVHKPGHDDSTIPDNVRNAVNIYQTKGLIHGHSDIRAADPEHTNIVGNFHMTYARHEINCDNYPWLARFFNRGHHQIENDPRVWSEVESLIDAELSSASLSAQALDPSCQQFGECQTNPTDPQY
jgi:hypothetical protein